MKARVICGRTLAALFLLFTCVDDQINAQAPLFADYTARGRQSLEIFPKQFLMHDLIVQSDIILTPAIYRLINIPKNSTITRAHIANACFYLEQSNRFKHIRIALKPHAKGFNVHFDLTAHWLANRIVLTNVYWHKAYVQNLYIIQPGEPFDENKHQESLENIRHFYQEQGYADAAVSAQQKKIGHYKGINISISVNKGVRSKIKKIALELTATTLSDRNSKQLKTDFEKSLRKKLFGKYYSQYRIQNARHELCQKLIAADHPCAHVRFETTRLQAHAFGISITIDLDSKNIVKISGHKNFSREQINHVLADHINDNIPLTAPLIAYYLQRFYHQHDFIYATIDLMQTDQGWQIEIHEGTRTSKPIVGKTPATPPTQAITPPTIGNTIIIAPPQFDTNLVLSELAYQQGDTWNQHAIEKTISNLQELGALNAFSLHPLHTRDINDQQPIVIAITPDDPFELNAHAGGCIGSQSLGNTYTLGASLLYKYIGTHVHRFWLDTQLSRFCNNVGLHYQYPHVNGKSLWLQTDVTYQSCEQRCIGPGTPRLYNAHAFNAQGQLIYHNSIGQYTCTSGIQAIAIKNCCTPVAQALAFTPTCIGPYQTYFIMQPHAQWTFVDNPAEPTAGSISTIDADAHIGINRTATSFAKIMAEQSFFAPFFPSLTLALRARAEHLWSKKWEHILPSERFYLGGPCTIRSYQQNYAPPYGSYMQDGVSYVVAQGGSSLINLNAELRWHTHQRLTIVPFFDTGALKNPLLKTWCWSHALGAGIRYTTPLGPVRFDIGWKLTQSPRDLSSYAWFLSFGNTF